MPVASLTRQLGLILAIHVNKISYICSTLRKKVELAIDESILFDLPVSPIRRLSESNLFIAGSCVEGSVQLMTECISKLTNVCMYALHRIEFTVGVMKPSYSSAKIG